MKPGNVSSAPLPFSRPNCQNRMTWQTLSPKHLRYGSDHVYDTVSLTRYTCTQVYRKESPEDAARVLSTAITHYTSKGNFRRAATHQQNLAEVYEVEIGDQKKALEAYNTAAEWYESDNAEALANKLYLKVAVRSPLACVCIAAFRQEPASLFHPAADSFLGPGRSRWRLPNCDRQVRSCCQIQFE